MRVTIRGLCEAAAILTVVSSLIALLPTEHHALQLFVHFRLQYLAASVSLVVVFAVWRESRYVVALLLAGALNAFVIVPWYSDARPAATGTEVKVLLANVLAGNEQHERLFELIDTEQPDVVVLLEVTPRWASVLPAIGGTFADSIVEAREGSFGIAMYSKLPVISAATVESPPLGLPTIVATLAVGAASLNVVATHPMHPVGKPNYDARNAQLDALARLLQKSDGPRLLVGDLNATLWDPPLRSLENRARLRNARRGFGLLPTWPMFMPVAMIPIDHVLVSDEIGVRDVRTGPRIGSDHLPLIATLTL